MIRRLACDQLRLVLVSGIVWIGIGVPHVVVGQTIIIDNTDAEFSVLSGSWSTGTSAPGHWADSYLFRSTSTSYGEVEWRANLPAAGAYAVATYYPEGSNRASDAQFCVSHANGQAHVTVNQQTRGGSWVPLGVYDFAAGSGAAVTLDNDAGPSVVIADAVRFEPAPPPITSFRGFWADAFHEGFRSEAEIDAMVGRAKQGNYNAIIAEVLAYHDNVGGGHGAYWNSAIVPRASDIVGGIDPLAYLCDAAHANGLEVHCWIVPFRVSTSWPPSGNALLASHPEWFMVEQADMGIAESSGAPAKIGTKYFLDPGSRDAQNYLVSIVRELIDGYALDGINLDYIRYEQTDAGYPADTTYAYSSLARYQSINSTSGTPSPTGNSAWNDFRRRTITEVVRRTFVELATSFGHPRHPLRLSADLIGFGQPPSGCDFTQTSSYALHQNWIRWIDEGVLDAAVPMGYKREHCVNQDTSYRGWVDCAADTWTDDRHLFSGQGNYLNSFTNSFTQMQYALNAGADGTVNYSYASTRDTLVSCSSSSTTTDWDWYIEVAESAFTGPADPPTMPWRDPATATEAWVWGQVTDHATGEPIDNAAITTGYGSTIRTDGNGYYVAGRRSAAPWGSPFGMVVAAGTQSRTISGVTLLPADVLRVDVVLGGPLIVGDMNNNGWLTEADWPLYVGCMQGPSIAYPADDDCVRGDGDGDLDVDLVDYGAMQRAIGN